MEGSFLVVKSLKSDFCVTGPLEEGYSQVWALYIECSFTYFRSCWVLRPAIETLKFQFFFVYLRTKKRTDSLLCPVLSVFPFVCLTEKLWPSLISSLEMPLGCLLFIIWSNCRRAIFKLIGWCIMDSYFLGVLLLMEFNFWLRVRCWGIHFKNIIPKKQIAQK